METNTIYSEDSRQRIQNRIASAVKTKLLGNNIENADELSVKFTEMMANGHSKEEVLSELEKYSKVDEGKTSEQVERHNKSFVDWLFGYSSVVSVVPAKQPTTNNNDTPVTEADTEVSIENQLNIQPTLTPPIDDVTEGEEDEDEKEQNEELDEEVIEETNNTEIANNPQDSTTPAAIAEYILNQEQELDDVDINDKLVTDDEIDDEGNSSDDSDDIPELQSRDSDEEQNEPELEAAPELPTEEVKVETEATDEVNTETEEKPKEVEEKVEEKKPEVPKRRSFIRIKEGKSGRFTPIKSEDRHSFVKRNLARAASQLDVASQVQKKMMSHAVAVANASENLLSKKKSSASLNNNGLEKKKSLRRESINSNSSSNPSVYSSTNATFIQSFANKNYTKTNKTSNTTTATGITPDKSKVVRCSYWPNCNRGDECKFWHPKELCPNLNNCPDGDQCLYIHPAVPQNQLNKNKKKKSESNLEVSEGFTAPKHTLQKKLSKRDSMLSLNGGSIPTLTKKSSKINMKEVSTTNTNNASANSYAIECKFGANCNRPDCKFSHPSPAAILAAKKKAESTVLLKKKDSKIKEKKSHDLLKHKESRTKLSQEPDEKKISVEEAQTILCRFDPDCKRTNCKFLHTNK